MFLVLAFFYRAITVQLLLKYHILLVFTQEGFYMARQVKETKESNWIFFSVCQKLAKHNRI